MTVGMRHSIQNFKQMSFVSNDNGGGSRSGGVKKTAADNIRTATRSTDINSTTVNARTSSLSAPCLYGVGAARTKTGSGVHHNAKAFYSNDNFLALQQSNQGLHFQLDVNRDLERLANIRRNIPNNKMNTFEKIAMLTAVTGTVTAGILGALNAGKTTQTTQTSSVGGKSLANSEIPTKDTKETGTPASLTAMKGANDSTTLSAAITKAEADQSAIPAKLQAANGELNGLKGQTDKLKNDSETAEKNYQTNLDDIKTTGEQVNQLKTSVSTLEQSIESLEARLQQSLDANGLPGPDTAAIQTNLERAKAQLNEQKQKLSETETKLNDLQGQTEGLKQAAGDAKDAYDKNLKDIETKQNEIKDLEQAKKDFETEIPKQKKRLQELEKKEDSELTKLSGQVSKMQSEITKLNNSINPNDENGLSKGEIKNKEKADKLQGELDKLKEKQAELQKRQAIRNLPQEPGFPLFKSGLMPDGTTAYFVSGKQVTQEEYQAQLENAKNS